MKKTFFLFSFLVISFIMSYAQSSENINAIKRQIENKAKVFCNYVVAVGTTAGQSGAVSMAVKNDIINNHVPGLFWDYYEAPRYMLTTNGPNGKVIKRRKMSAYFTSLKFQSRENLNYARKYELRYEGFVNGATSGFKYVRTLSDGCELWSTTIRIKQLYHMINFNSPTTDGRAIDRVETTVKDFEVYVVKKPNGKVGVFLGNVKRAYNE